MHEYLEKFLLGKLNLDLLGDNTKERMMADQIIENGLRNKLMKFGAVKQHYIIQENMQELLTVLVFMKIKKLLLILNKVNKPKKDEWIEDYYLQCSGLCFST